MKLSAKIGAIQFSGDEVRIAVVKTGGRLPKVLEAHHVRIAPSGDEDRHEAMTAAVRSMIAGVKSRPAVYVLVASSAWCVVRKLKIPFKGRRRVAAAVRYELEPHLAFPIEEVAVDFVPIREVDGETEVLVVGARRDRLEEQLAVLNAAGVAVEGIGLDAAGLAALWQARGGAGSGMRALLDVGRDGAVLIITLDKRPVLVRYVPVPAARLQEQPAASGREIQHVLRAFSAGWGEGGDVASLTVSGARLFDEERALFQGELKAPVEFTGLLDGVKGLDGPNGAVQGAEETADEWSAVVGGAFASAGAPFTIDFLKDPQLGGTPYRGLAAHAVFTAFLFVLAALGYGLYQYLEYRQNMAEVERLGQAVWEEFVAAFPNSPNAKQRPAGDIGGFKSLKLMEEEAERERQQGRALQADVYTKPTFLDLLREIARIMPDSKMSIENIQLTYRPGFEGDITISGLVKDSAAFGEVQAELGRSSLFRVDGNKTRRASDGGKETFSVTLIY